MYRRDFLKAMSAGAALAPIASEAMATTETPFDPTETSIADLTRALESGAATSESLTAAYIGRIARFDRSGPEYRSVLALNPRALEIARVLDRERAAGKTRGPLHGIPILLKDNIETLDPLPTTAGSLALEHSTHATDAPLAARLRAAGAVFVGKTNLSEWANFRSTHSSSGWSGVGGQTRNAYDRRRTPSGSSSGSGVAAALSFCAAAIGTETNGSILSPSAHNGLVGLKPTIGMVSGRGVVPISPVQDIAGPMARSVLDAAALMAAIAERPVGFGAHGKSLEDFRLRGVRIGVMEPSDSAHPDAVKRYANARDVLTREGAELIDLKAPDAFKDMGEAPLTALLYDFKAAINEYLAGLDPAKVPSRSLADLIAFNTQNAAREMPIFGQELFEMAQACGPLSDERYQKARATLKRCTDDEGLAKLLATQRVDLLMALGAGPAEVIDEVWGHTRGGGSGSIASAAAIAGYPSLTVPGGLARGLPVGISLVGRRFEDGLLLQVARGFERAAEARIPPTLG
jgi:amidase